MFSFCYTNFRDQLGSLSGQFKSNKKYKFKECENIKLHRRNQIIYKYTGENDIKNYIQFYIFR